jgi:hypothetical protein
MKEMAIHHSLLIYGGFGVLATDTYAGFCMIGLLMEVNSIFLHSRALLQYCNQRKSLMFKIASVGNILTNIVFRLGVGYTIYKWYADINFSNDFMMGKI